ncbi:ABC transporter permease [Pseudomonas aeruginosa]|uniref:ABC transporter permease n=1 Tax=Pseudomonas aeruginosa TaxID=287 RepID=UPI0003BB1AA3|nr:iron ABC transporter permease [Pseudomonas aeruginosa]EJN1504092.1 iron ABC transporter permease [Pseudomonas aeruginosa]ELH7249981.1 iron ABC transporter permease [Pseudomonas aeruginosa]ELL4390393.1 iron ABC transporter permease [Pseudomonas aeruginosa]ERX03098.1 iron ABC transporter, permease [Pseudomonas aeruginosa BWHPSA001]MBP8371187.1 iron ABC transporter permease [Pseudomonas aeruginosa]
MAHPAPRRWYPITFTVAALVLLPLSVLLLSWLEIDREIWSHLWDTQLPRLLGNTLTLVLGVGIGVTLLGVSLAWLTSLCEFPGRRWLDWALMLPFAIPAYVLAFVFVGLLDFAGPVQSLLREWFGSGLRLPRVRSTGGVILVLVLVFYPYVYLLARSAFIAQGKGLMEAARVLGLSPWQAFLRVALPMARPAIGAGLALAVMETLADFGAVSVFNFDTFTTAIYKTWYGFYSLSSAAQLASLLLLGVCLVLLGERHTRGRAKAASERPRGAPLYRLRGARALVASAWCGLVFLCAFVIPVAQLVVWFWRQGRFDLDERYWDLIGHTLTLGGIAALATVAVALLLAFAVRLAPTRAIRGAVGLGNLGYALPGSVLAVSIMLAFSWLDNHWVIPLSSALGGAGKPLLLGSLFALLLAYLIRFMAVAYGPLESGLARIRPSLPEASRSLGVGGPLLFLRVYLPLLLPASLSAALLVFVDVLKEMPATLLMRPFGWDTLAVRIFEMTSEGEWARASLPALTLVLVGLLPVVGLIRRSAHHSDR